MSACRHCETALPEPFLDLGHAPPSNAYLSEAALWAPEVTYPLRLRCCPHCWLVQTDETVDRENLFNAEYAYFSSTSTSWLAHAKRYVDDIVARLALTASSQVVEVASNDGYLLQYFQAAGIPCLGIEPTASTADAAEARGIRVIREYFGSDLARSVAESVGHADLIIGNNVYAHVPDVNDFSAGLCHLLSSEGVVTLEFPHLATLMSECQFDTVYHEHYSYLSLWTVERIFERAGLRVFDVEQLPTHGGSLRVYGCRASAAHQRTDAVDNLVAAETEAGLRRRDTYAGFQARAEAIKDDLVSFLIDAKRQGTSVVGYGAAAKGNTLLNFAGVRRDLLPYVCDAAPSKQGKFLPGSHIPIKPPAALEANPPDVILILPWNIADEVRSQLQTLRGRGTRFATAVPRFQWRS